MNDMTPTPAQREAKLEGMGCRRKRVEDIRFTQGKGNYVDDLKLPGMLFGDFVRSPYGHAQIKSIDKEAALAVPGVIAILTAEDLKPLNLHYMPTLAGDVQAVLADEKVLFQNQEVAFIIAEDRYAAADAAELVDVDYAELPVINNAFQVYAAVNHDVRQEADRVTDHCIGEVVGHDEKSANRRRENGHVEGRLSHKRAVFVLGRGQHFDVDFFG